MSLRAVALEALTPPAERSVPPGPGPTVDRALQLERLRQELARRQADWKREEQESRCPTGLADVDRLLGGGFPKGLVTALGGPAGAGVTSTVVHAMAQATQAGECCAFVDGSGSLAAPALAEYGVDLSRLLVVRATAEDAAWSAQLLARSGAFSLVAVDVPASGWSLGAMHRLSDAVRAGGCALVLLSRELPVSAAVKARLEAGITRRRWLQPLEKTEETRESSAGPQRHVRLWLERSRRGGESSSEVVLYRREAGKPPDAWQADTTALQHFERRRPGPESGSLPLLTLTRRLHTRPRSRFRPPLASGGERP